MTLAQKLNLKLRLNLKGAELNENREKRENREREKIEIKSELLSFRHRQCCCFCLLSSPCNINDLSLFCWTRIPRNISRKSRRGELRSTQPETSDSNDCIIARCAR